MNKSFRPFRVAVTGGIGSGKSFVCRQLEAAGYPVFYCDDEAKRIMRTSVAVRKALTMLVGEKAYGHDGKPNKAVLAAYICENTAQAERINAIVHPAVAQAFNDWCCQQTASMVFMECALLFESGFDKLANVSVEVFASQATRERRVMARDHAPLDKVRDWINLQLPEEEKARRADIIVHNGEKDDTTQEVNALLQRLNHMETLTNEKKT